MYPVDTTSGRATIEPFSSAVDEMCDIDETRTADATDAADEPIPGRLEVSVR